MSSSAAFLVLPPFYWSQLAEMPESSECNTQPGEGLQQVSMDSDQPTTSCQEMPSQGEEEEEVEVVEELRSDKLKKFLWDKLVKLGKAIYQLFVWLLYLLGSCLGILWIVFNMWICSLVSTEFEKLGCGRDGSFIIGMTVGLLDYFFAPLLLGLIFYYICTFFENLETKNACIIWFFQTPAYPASEEGEDRDSPARRALQEREADKPPAYKDCVKKSYTVKLPSYLKSLKEEEEGPPDYTTAVGRIV